jgi:hypothetical protein
VNEDSVNEVLVHVLHQFEVLGVVNRDVDQHRHALLQSFAQNRAELHASGAAVVGLFLERHHVVGAAVPDQMHKPAANADSRFQLRGREQKTAVAGNP